MTTPVTTLSGIILLAHQQYGIRFQLRQQQLVDFVNMIQFIAFNQDYAGFENWEEKLVLGQEIFLESLDSFSGAGDYVSPVSGDIGKKVVADGVYIGTLLNYQTKNKINKWIVAPLDGGNGTIYGLDGLPLSIEDGTGAGTAVTGQGYLVAMGPYRTPKEADGALPFRKFRGITTLTDEQRFASYPAGSEDLDYGLPINNVRSRSKMWPTEFDITKMEVTLKGTTRPQIIQTDLGYGYSEGGGGTTLNTSNLRWVYYFNPPTITSINDESKLILPERYRYEVLYKGISRLADTATYGDAGSVRQLIEPLCERFWEDMRTQYQAFGSSSDWISEG